MTPRPNTLAKALRPESPLRARVQPGLSAVKTADRSLIAASERARIGDSLDLDEATAAEFPQGHRWDYILSVPDLRKLIALEPHTASDGEVKVVIKKKQQALAYLRDHLHATVSVAEWHWVTRGTVGFSRMDKAVRALNQNGISFSGRSLKSCG